MFICFSTAYSFHSSPAPRVPGDCQILLRGSQPTSRAHFFHSRGHSPLVPSAPCFANNFKCPVSLRSLPDSADHAGPHHARKGLTPFRMYAQSTVLEDTAPASSSSSVLADEMVPASPCTSLFGHWRPTTGGTSSYGEARRKLPAARRPGNIRKFNATAHEPRPRRPPSDSAVRCAESWSFSPCLFQRIVF